MWKEKERVRMSEEMRTHALTHREHGGLEGMAFCGQGSG